MTDTKSKLGKCLEWIVNGVFALPFVWLIILIFLLSIHNDAVTILLLPLLIALTFLFRFSFKKMDEKIEDKKLYITFFTGLGVFALVSGLLISILFFLDTALLGKFVECFYDLKTLIVIVFGVFSFITLFLWAIKQIRFRWFIIMFILYSFIGILGLVIDSISVIIDDDHVVDGIPVDSILGMDGTGL